MVVSVAPVVVSVDAAAVTMAPVVVSVEATLDAVLAAGAVVSLVDVLDTFLLSLLQAVPTRASPSARAANLLRLVVLTFCLLSGSGGKDHSISMTAPDTQLSRLGHNRTVLPDQCGLTED